MPQEEGYHRGASLKQNEQNSVIEERREIREKFSKMRVKFIFDEIGKSSHSCLAATECKFSNLTQVQDH